MSTELVLSRGCRHNDWRTIPQTPIEFCLSCGFALIFAAGRPMKDAFKEVQIQPRLGATFALKQTPLLANLNYQYDSLDLEHGRQIRVLVLKAGKLNDPLRCELEHVNLQQGPIYEALSYTWADAEGNDSVCKKIQCGTEERFIGITQNCETALLRLRRAGEDRRLWVDAVCIDQSNTLERNHQVKNMTVIFRSALRVLVYLGEGSTMLGRLVDYISDDTPGQLPQVFDFVTLFQKRWFHRVWVLQEIAVAKSVLVMCGDKTMSWKDLMEHSNLFLRLMAARNLPLALPPVISYGLHQTTLTSREQHGKSDLLSLLKISRNCSCKDARDKVYAILGLLAHDSSIPLRADYSETTAAGWVYLQVAALILASTKSLIFLSLVEGASDFDMPSWVPDWTKRSPVSLPKQLEVSDCPAPRLTSRDGKNLLSEAIPNYPIDCILRVSGQRYGTVWTDRTIKTSAPRALADIRRYIAGEWEGITDTRKYARDCGAHWLHDPLQNGGGEGCNRRNYFWSRILSDQRTSDPYDRTRYYESSARADIPPAFGGPCWVCFRWSATFRKNLMPCCCSSFRNALAHFDDDELQDFLAKMNHYGLGRKVFGTDHSLGFGPMEIQDWDEVWMLDGAEVPFVLRRVNNSYKLVGACYVHALSRTIDRCATCKFGTSRGEITLRPRYTTAPVSTSSEELPRKRPPILHPSRETRLAEFKQIARKISVPAQTQRVPWIHSRLRAAQIEDISSLPSAVEQSISEPLDEDFFEDSVTWLWNQRRASQSDLVAPPAQNKVESSLPLAGERLIDKPSTRGLLARTWASRRRAKRLASQSNLQYALAQNEAEGSLSLAMEPSIGEPLAIVPLMEEIPPVAPRTSVDETPSGERLENPTEHRTEDSDPPQGSLPEVQEPWVGSLPRPQQEIEII